jgi:hypothetical protein
MSIKITIPNSSSDVLTFGSGNTPTAAQIAGIDSGSSNGQLALYTTASGTSTERVRVDASGNVGIGATPSAWGSAYSQKAVQVGTVGSVSSLTASSSNQQVTVGNNCYFDGTNWKYITSDTATRYLQYQATHVWYNAASGTAGNAITFTSAMILDASGNLLVGKTASGLTTNGFELNNSSTTAPYLAITNSTATSGDGLFTLNRQSSDGTLAKFRQANTDEGSISVSGTTVSYNGGHLSRWAQTTTAKDESLVKGTVLSNLDEMNVYTDTEGNTVDNEQLNKVKVSDVEGDVNVAGVFVNWMHDDSHDVDEINMAMTGDMIIRIAQGVTVARGDLLMSAGDGTAKPQDDDIVRSKTIAKVTSTHVTCTYADGSFCVPCVLMAC